MRRAGISIVALVAALWPVAANAADQEAGGFAAGVWIIAAIVMVVGYSLSKVQPWAGFIVYPYVLYTTYSLAMELTGQVPHPPFDQEGVSTYYMQAVAAVALQLLVPIVGYLQGRKAQ
ncbi:MAG TPA: hypothetical protein VJV39_12525 [Dongiaceae bacterium]|nr:hypothetical protein [Dongiaceae bacterium]